MSDIMEQLNQVDMRLSDDNFLANKGMSNEVGIHVFSYKPSEEIVVSEFFKKLIADDGKKYHLIECDLYKIFLEICEDKHILKGIPKMEETKGKDFLKEKLVNVATPEAFVEKMKYENHQPGRDVLLITGIGKVYPFMRASKILDNIQHIFADIPVVVLYPGKYDGQSMDLFEKFHDGNYYRAFNLL